MAATRLDDESDKIAETLSLALMDASNSAVKNRSIQTMDLLASSSWQEVINALLTCTCGLSIDIQS